MPVVRDDAAVAWASSGAMALTGRAGGPPLVPPGGVVDRIRGLGAPLGLDPLPLLGERAAIAGLRRRGAVSCGGTTRLLPARDGWIAVSLAREADVTAVPAWLELGADVPGDPWPVVAGAVVAKPAAAVVERGVLLDLPVAAVPAGTRAGARGDVRPEAGGPVEAVPVAEGGGGARGERPLVVDLSSLWAGPLCARLLGERGARVVKVESLRRPDGARSGPAAFFDLLHHGHEMVALDLGQAKGVDQLRRLLQAADVVIEASRPRALVQLGIDASELLRQRPGPAVWVSITGHGRHGPGRNRVAFGDDAAAAGGLVARDGEGPCFVADAVADPLSGVAAASAVTTALQGGGRWLLDVAMSRVAAFVAAGAHAGHGHPEPWRPGPEVDAAPPHAATPAGRAAPLGAHTHAVLAELP